MCPQTFSQRLYQEYTCYTVFFVSIEICQISDVLIRKTRRLSVFQQGLFRSAPAHTASKRLSSSDFFNIFLTRLSICRNRVLVSAIVFQLCLGTLLCYCPGMPNIFNFMPIR